MSNLYDQLRKGIHASDALRLEHGYSTETAMLMTVAWPTVETVRIERTPPTGVIVTNIRTSL